MTEMLRATWRGLDGRLAAGRQHRTNGALPKQDTGEHPSLRPLPATMALVPFVPIDVVPKTVR
jgi:hypothetical protein